MNKVSGIIFILLGAVLISSALFLSRSNEMEDQAAGTYASEVMEQLRDHIATAKPTTVPTVPTTTENDTSTVETEPPEMETMTANGYAYIGYLSIPVLELELPVMAQWDYKRLQIAPCRETGTTAGNDLVIAAHNYYSHFGRLNQLEAGAQVIFTEVDGFINTYAVVSCQVLQPSQVEDVLLSGYDLVLYTCTKGGATRVVLYCNREKPAEQK